MKRNKGILVIVLSICILLVGGVGAYFHQQTTNKWTSCINYDGYSEEFNLIAEYLLQEFPTDANKWFGVSVTNETGRGFYDADINDLIESPAEVIEALNKVSDYAFADCEAAFESIRVQNGCVYFCVSDGEYALAFSKEAKPAWLNDDGGVKQVFTKSAGNGWYHIRAEAIDI